MNATREQMLAEAFVQAADTLLEDFDILEFLHGLTGHCVQLLDVDAAGVMLADPKGQLHATAASSENARLLELFELQADAGPGLDAYRSAAAVVNTDLAANQDRWPRFAEAAHAAGYASVHALPLRLRAVIVGVLNLFCANSGTLSDADAHVGQALADVATIAILAQRERHQAEQLAGQLQRALSNRVTIEQAKGVLAERRGVSVDSAFTLLRDHARSHNQHLTDLARQITDGTSTATELLTGPQHTNTDAQRPEPA